MMPKMSGYEVCQKIRQTYSDDILPIIFITAKTQTRDLVEALRIGNDYLPKPFSNEELLARVQAHMRVQEGVERWVSLREIIRQFGRLKDPQYADFILKEFQRLRISSRIQLLGAHEKQEEADYACEIPLQNEQRVYLARDQKEGDFPRRDTLYLERIEHDLKLLAKNEYLTLLKGKLLTELIRPNTLYIEGKFRACTIVDAAEQEKYIEASLRQMKTCCPEFIQVSKNCLVHLHQIVDFILQKQSPRKNNLESCYVIVKKENNEEIHLKIGKSFIPQLVETLPPLLKKRFEIALEKDYSMIS